MIMIGEIRDAETARIAVQASLTGHLVLATLHTNDAVSAVTRLVDMGIEPFLLASSLLGVLGQRLFRRLCPACHQDAVALLSCTTCNRTGYQGRSGVYELLEISGSLRSLIHERAAEADIRQEALAWGFRTLAQDGERWVESGLTTRKEMLRVTGDT